MSADVTGIVHSIETLGTVDGPGLRTVVFLEGCPLRCKFCHNIDCAVGSQLAKGTQSHEYTADQLVETVLKSSPYWNTYDPYVPGDYVSGGVTFSGGEPTVQHAFLLQVLQKLKKRNVHTALDSCSVTSQEVLASLIPYIDLWMLSVKHMDDEQHTWLTGVSNRRILENIRFIDSSISDYNKQNETSKQLRIRFLVIPGITDQPDHIKRVGAFVKTLHNLEHLEVLGYGSHGSFKWNEIFGSYDLAHVRDATDQDIKQTVAILNTFDLPLKYPEQEL